MKLKLSKTVKTRDAAIAGRNGRPRVVGAIRARRCMQSGDLYSVKHCEPKNREVDVVNCKVVGAQSKSENIVKGFHLDSAGSYRSIHRNFIWYSVTLSKRLKEVFDCKPRSYQQNVSDAVHVALEKIWALFVNV